MTELYRYDSTPRYDGGVTIYLSKFHVIKKTEKGAWINGARGRTFCLEGSGKRYAHATKELAFDSFKARKKRQALILSAQLRGVEKVQEVIDGLKGELPPQGYINASEYDLYEGVFEEDFT